MDPDFRPRLPCNASYVERLTAHTSPIGTDSSWCVVGYRVPDFIGGRGDTGVEAPRYRSFPSSSGVGMGPGYVD